MRKAFGAIALTLFGVVIGAMLTTDYSTLRANGSSYWTALQSGLLAVWAFVVSIITSVWFLVLAGAILLVVVTSILTRRALRPKANPYAVIGRRMNHFVDVAHHDQKFRDFRSLYHDTMRVCREMEAFMFEVNAVGLPIPSPQTQSAEDWIDLCCDYLTAVGPFLRNGNFEHAKRLAMQFSERNPPLR